MSQRTVYTCDLCNKEVDEVKPIRIECGEHYYAGHTLYSMKTLPLELLQGDSCEQCLRAFVEKLRSEYYFHYKINDGKDKV